MPMIGMPLLRRGGARTRHSPVVTVVVAAALAMLAGAPLPAAGETPPRGGAGEAACPSSSPPNAIALTAGTPQTAMLGDAFATALQVALANSDGCPVSSEAAGAAVTFSAPSSGASGRFAASGSSTVTVGSDASGAAAAPLFTANDTPGSYTVTATSEYGSVSFRLTNAAAGLPATVTALAPGLRTASVLSRYSQPLQARVLDGDGDPVAGASVTFTLGSSATASDVCGATASPGAGFLGGGTQASASTNASGVASSPPFTANGASGTFTASAAVSGGAPGAAAGDEAGALAAAIAPQPASFELSNLAGRPARLAAGVAATQSTPTGTRFPLRLAVAVTDAEKNPVAGALVAFTAPAAGPSGRFAIAADGHRGARSHQPHPHAVQVRSDACGIALAPALAANRRRGGYIVRASVEHVRPVAFALVNEGS